MDCRPGDISELQEAISKLYAIKRQHTTRRADLELSIRRSTGISPEQRGLALAHEMTNIRESEAHSIAELLGVELERNPCVAHLLQRFI